MLSLVFFNVLTIFNVYALSIQIGSFVEVEVHNMYALLAFVILFQSPALIHSYLSELYQDKYILSQFQNYTYQILHVHFHCKAFVKL